MVEELLGEERDWVAGLVAVGLTQGLGKHVGNLVLLQVGDVAVFLSEEHLQRICNVCLAGGQRARHVI